MPNASIAHAYPIHAWGFITTLRPVKRPTGVALLLGAILLIGGCAGTFKSAEQKDQAAAHDRQGYKHAESAYLAGDYPQALRILHPLADEGDAEAQYILGYMYYYGQGVPSDPRAAREWIGKSATQGHDKARIALSRFEAANTKPQAVTQQAVAVEPLAEEPLAEEPLAEEQQSPQHQMSPQAPNIPATMNERKTFEQQLLESQSPQELAPAMTQEPVKPETASPMMETKLAPQPGSYEWVLVQSPTNLTIQLLATQNRLAAQDFVRQHGISADATVFEFLREGKPWFSVIYGSFAGMSQTKAAIQDLPSVLRAQLPWVRGFSGIQDIIIAPGQ